MTADLPARRSDGRPLYARVLFLKHLNPSGAVCFCFFEGAVALGILLALAELVELWAIPVLPVVVAAMVKLNDIVAGAVVRSAEQVPDRERARFRRERTSVVGRARVARKVSSPSHPATGKVAMDGAGIAGPPVGSGPGAGPPAAPPRQAGPPDAHPPVAPDADPSTGEADPVTPSTPAWLVDRATTARHHGVGPAGSTRTGDGTAAGEAGQQASGLRAIGRAGAGAYAINEHPTEPVEHRPPRSWPAGIEEPDTPEQRARQSGSHHYE